MGEAGLMAEAYLSEQDLSQRLREEEESHALTIDQREAMEDGFSRAFTLVMGRDMCWSNRFGIEEALEEMREKLAEDRG